MNRLRRSLIPGVIVAAALLLILTQALPGPSARAQAPGGVAPQSMPGGEPITYYATKGNGTFRVPPRVPPGSVSIQTATINVNYLAAGQTSYFGQVCKAWPPAAQTAFNYGAGIWAATLNSTVPSTINACWTTLGAGILGSSGARSYYRDFTGAPQAGTWYPVALANALSGVDQNGSTEEMNIVYSDAFTWYFGTDGITPVGSYDLVSVVLHEIAHGWGFAGSMYSASSNANWGFSSNSGYPVAYDRFAENGAGQSLLNTALFPNPGTALKAQLTSNNLYFNGPHAKAANGGNRPPLYAPSTWSQGSSYAHLANSFDGTINALMTSALADGESNHDPGPVGLGVLYDVGWPTPDVSIQKAAILSRPFAPGDHITYTLRLSNSGGWPASGIRVTDTLPASLLDRSYTSTLTIANADGANYIWTVAPLAAGASGVISVYARIDPALPVTGTVVNTVQVSDPQDHDLANNSSTVSSGGYKVYLPLVLRNYGPPAGIYGHVTAGGVAASGVALDLRFWNGSVWSTQSSTTTDSSGNYSFVGAPTLTAGQSYSVRYLNGQTNSARLSYWSTRQLTSYAAGSSVSIGDFDLTNITLSAPAPGVTLTLPINFLWQVRTATTGDNYEVDFFNPSDNTTYGWTPQLGYVGSYWLNALPVNQGSGPAFTSGPRYGWYMAVYSPDNGYGESYYYRPIAFSGAAAGGAQQPLAIHPRDPERLPPLADPAP